LSWFLVQPEWPDEPIRLRQAKAAKNQSLFREVNERVKDVRQHHDWFPYDEDAICECANETCSERIKISATEYARIRERGTCFLVLPSDEHVFADVEEVIEKHENYWIVEKIERAALVAEKLDPRKRDRAI
jgi:hypothetical protein